MREQDRQQTARYGCKVNQAECDNHGRPDFERPGGVTESDPRHHPESQYADATDRKCMNGKLRRNYSEAAAAFKTKPATIQA